MSANHKNIEALFVVLREMIGDLHSSECDEFRSRFAALLFTDASDDGMARFFVQASAEMRKWGAAQMDMQLCLVGEHLNECECSDVHAIKFIDDLHAFAHPETIT